MKKIIPFIFLIFIFSQNLIGQNNSGTPYSKYGFGMLQDNYGSYTNMGGVSAGMRDNNNVNFLNPASYTALDSMRFYFQAGISAEYVDIRSYKHHSDYKVAQNASINMAFRAAKKLFMSFGFNQISNIGYDLYYSNPVAGDPYKQFLQLVEGEGGLNEFYIGFGYKLWNLSVGVNASYIFGKIEDRQTLEIYENLYPIGYYLKTRTQNHINSGMLTFGLQYPIKLNQKSNLIVGTSFNVGTYMNAKQVYEAYKIGVTSGRMYTINDERLNRGKVYYPTKITGGFNYIRNNKLNIALDYTFQDMKNYKEFGEKQEYQSHHRINFGTSYLPNEFGRNWFQRNKYTFGAYFTRSFLNLYDTDINTYGVTVGTQIPFRFARQELLLGIAGDFGMRGTKRNNLLFEQYAKIRVNVAFKELWFVKRKIN